MVVVWGIVGIYNQQYYYIYMYIGWEHDDEPSIVGVPGVPYFQINPYEQFIWTYNIFDHIWMIISMKIFHVI